MREMRQVTKTLRDIFLHELMDMCDALRRLVRALPKMAKAATSLPSTR